MRVRSCLLVLALTVLGGCDESGRKEPGEQDAAADAGSDPDVDASPDAEDAELSDDASDAMQSDDGGVFCMRDEDCPRPAHYPTTFAEHGQCVKNRCEDCDPETNEPCGAGGLFSFTTPICGISREGVIACRGCADDEECKTRGGGPRCTAGGYCGCTNFSFEESGCDISSNAPVCFQVFVTGGGPMSCGPCLSDAGSGAANPCGSARPICLGDDSPHKGRCVKCRDDRDCAGSAETRCDATSHECVR